jgi:hypothetical protein
MMLERATADDAHAGKLAGRVIHDTSRRAGRVALLAAWSPRPRERTLGPVAWQSVVQREEERMLVKERWEG